MIQVAIVDDHQLFRKSLVLLLSMFQDIEVVFDTDDGNKFLQYAQKQTIDVLLLDLQMPKISGFEVCISIKETHPETRVLIVSQLNSKEIIHQIMACGANGFVSKNASPDQLNAAIIKVYDDDFYFDMELGAVVREAILWEHKNKVEIPIIVKGAISKNAY
jgi:DNA-binding NarL/FixJ family response regulator